MNPNCNEYFDQLLTRISFTSLVFFYLLMIGQTNDRSNFRIYSLEICFGFVEQDNGIRFDFSHES